MTHYLYTTINGIFLFNQNFKLIEKTLFKKSELLKINQDLKQGKWLKKENEYLKKFKNIKFLGLKDSHTHYCTLDSNLINKARTNMDFYKFNLELTRQQIRNSVTNDLLVIQAISGLEELKRSINLLSKRLREWFEYYCPEYSKYLHDNEAFAELIIKKTKDSMLRELDVKDSMGKDLSKEDLKPILSLAKEINQLAKIKVAQTEYLEHMMRKSFSNLNALTGALIGAKLIMHAGSLERLSKFPASTIQLLGAEKALFRHIKSGNKCPKYGVLLQHSLVASAREKGRVARTLANKIAIAVKCDLTGTKGYGTKARKDLDKRFKR